MNEMKMFMTKKHLGHVFHRASGSIPHRQPRFGRQQVTRSKVPHFVLRLGTSPSLKILIQGDFLVKKSSQQRKS